MTCAKTKSNIMGPDIEHQNMKAEVLWNIQRFVRMSPLISQPCYDQQYNLEALLLLEL